MFLHVRQDVFLPDVLPIHLTRTYRPNDAVSRPFGYGTSHNYAYYLHGNITSPKLILPDGGQIRFDAVSGGGWRHIATPGQFQHAWLDVINTAPALGLPVPGNYAFRLTLKNRTVFYFAPTAPSNLLRIVDRNGNMLNFSSSGGLVNRITTRHGRYIDFVYDGSNRITQIKDIADRSWTYEYDAAGYLSKATYPDSTFEAYTYDASGRMLTVTDRRGNVMVTNVYDGNGRVQQQTLADTGVYQFAYTLDANGKVVQTDITDARNHVRRLLFNGDGYVTSETHALGTALERTRTYVRQGGLNLLHSAIDFLGRKTQYIYDAKNNMASITRMSETAEAATESFTYDTVHNQVLTHTDALNKTTTFAYDANGNLTTVTDPLNNTVTTTYNTAGQPQTVTNGVNKTVTLEYDAGDLVQITDPLGRATQRYFDVLGRLRVQTDPLGNRAQYEYDPVDRIKRVIDPRGAVTEFLTDGNGNLTRVTDALNGVHQYAYDAKNRLSTYTDPLNKAQVYQYDGRDNVVSYTDRKLQTSMFTYDALNRRTLATFADGSTLTDTYDAADRQTQAVDSLTGTVSRAYDNFDRVTNETTTEGTVSYTYDAGGRRTAMTVTGQAEVTYGYDNAHRLTSITQGTANVGFQYDAANRRTTLTLPSGIVATYGYDDASQLTSITYALGSNSVGDLVYEYDLVGRRTRASGSLASTNLPGSVTTTGHDVANRVINWNGVTLTYDDNGNLLSDGVRAYTWDARNRLVGISGGASAAFSYDALGRRLTKTVGGATTSFVYDGRNPVQERSAGSPVANMLTGSRLDEFFRRTDTSGDRDFLTDALGSTLALADNSGAIRTSYQYSPYGADTASGEATSNPYKYTGREDDGTGLYYYRARYYDPALKRFLSEDPIGLNGGLNLYAYVQGNPILYTDPSGLQFQGAEPPSQIPGGPWNWSADPNNSRGGTFKGQKGTSCSWDQKGSHWDVDDGKGNRSRYDRWGNEIDKNDPHRYERERLPRVVPLRTPLLLCPACILFDPNPMQIPDA